MVLMKWKEFQPTGISINHNMRVIDERKIKRDFNYVVETIYIVNKEIIYLR